MNVDYEYDYPTQHEGWVHEDELPNFADTRDFIKGILEVLYKTGDVHRLEDHVEELCNQFDVEFELNTPKLEKTKHPLMEFHMDSLKEYKMNKEIVVKELKKIEVIDSEKVMHEIQGTTKICQTLMQYPHYKKLGAEGIFAIVEKAKSIGVSPLDALNGGMYFVQGKVEMSSAMMNQLIRMYNHSITKDKRSDDTICILHGKRVDNGDTWVESFSIEDAKKAGIYRNQWIKYPKDMLFARALSRLARQLFPDVIKGCYVQGEISEVPQTNVNLHQNELDINGFQEKPEAISDDQYQELEDEIDINFTLRQNLLTYMKSKWGIETLQEMPLEIYESAMNRAKKEKSPEELGEQQQMEA